MCWRPLLLLCLVWLVPAGASFAKGPSSAALQRYRQLRQRTAYHRERARRFFRQGNTLRHARSLVLHRSSKARAAALKVKRWRATASSLRQRARDLSGVRAARLRKRAKRLEVRSRRLSAAIDAHRARTTWLIRAVRKVPRLRSTPGARMVDAWRDLTLQSMGLAHSSVRQALSRHMPNFDVGVRRGRVTFSYRPGVQLGSASKGWSNLSSVTSAVRQLAAERRSVRTGADAFFGLSRDVTRETQGILDTSLRATAPSFSVKPGAFSYRSGTTTRPSSLGGAPGMIDTSLKLTRPNLKLGAGTLEYRAGANP
jgi:hypothetical protein